MKTISYFLSFAILMSLGQQLFSQDIKSSTKGFSLNLNYAYGSWNSESLFLGDLDDLEPAGTGYSVKAGYGINQNIEVLIAYSQLGFRKEFDWDSYQLSNFELGGRYNFGATLRWFRPFLGATIAFNNLLIDPITFDGSSVFELESKGVGATIGGGFHIFIIPNLSFNANGNLGFGNFNATSLSGTDVGDLGEKLDFTTVILHFGLTYFFE
ncbi:MAG: outer membrane beta-barrel protein [Saprospiraceae bacterium]